MAFRVLADLVVVVHAAFVAFVGGGALAVFRWPRLAWAHVPAAAWGALIELGGWTCPLTPLEEALRSRAGQAGYAGGFVDHYVVAALYPAGLTRPLQWGLGVGVLVLNIGAYGWLLAGRSRRRR